MGREKKNLKIETTIVFSATETGLPCIGSMLKGLSPHRARRKCIGVRLRVHGLVENV